MAFSNVSTPRSVVFPFRLLSPKGLHARVVARAEAGELEKSQGIVFYGGNSYTIAEWDEAKKSGSYKPAPESTEEVVMDAPMTISSIMAFDGPAPETVNSRLAMLGFISALGAEISSGENVFQQITDAPGAILVTFTTIAIASFIPLFEGMKPEAKQLGPFNAQAELYNGRAAMLGLVGLGVSELFMGGKALF